MALELMHPEHLPQGRIRAAIFDFDGTFSTLRCGWEKVMRPLMLEMISGGAAEDAPEALQNEVDRYIDESTGIQTVYQMVWLRDRVEAAGRAVPGRDEWWYKAEYSRRLMAQVESRLNRLEAGEDKPEQYLISGAIDFAKALRDRGVALYLASGTDHRDVVREASALGADKIFTSIQGAPEHKAACSKEAVIRSLLSEKGLRGEELLVVGDGKVEIALGAGCGGYTIGAATDEIHLCGVNPVKRARLISAGADVIVGDFSAPEEIFRWMDP